MYKPSKTAQLIAVVMVVGLARICSAADNEPTVFPPLQIFKDFCTPWSIDDVAQLAGQRHFAVISAEDIPLPDGNPAHKIIWNADTAVGPIAIVIVAGESKTHDITETCTVSTPLNSVDFVQLWIKNSLGDPAFTLKKPEGASEIHWAQTFEKGKIEVILLTQMPDKKAALISMMKHIKAPKHS